MMWMMADCETESWSETNLTPKLKMINCLVIIDDTEIARRSFATASAFVNYCEMLYGEYGCFKCFFHNLDFDAKYLFKTLMQRYHIDIIKNQSLIALKCQTRSRSVRYSTKRGRYHPQTVHFEFRDSLILFYHLSVKKLGEMVGLPKIEFTNFNADPTNPNYMEYCYRDCEIVVKALKFLRDMFATWGLHTNIENLPLTLPALSFNLFKLKNQRFVESIEDVDGKVRKQNRIFKVHSKSNAFYRQYYFGGRCEVFDMQTEPSDYTDINGLYQYIMDNFMMPIPEYTFYTPLSFNLWDRLTIPDLLTNNTYLDAEKIFAIECTVDDWMDKPVFCERVDGKSVFRRGSKRVFLSREEYQFCLDARIPILELHRIDMCREWAHLFTYFQEIYAYRKQLQREGNPGEKLVKLPPNATYGKLGQFATRSENQIIRTESLTAEQFLQLRDTAKNYWIADDCLIISNEVEIRFCEHNLALAGRITALARLHLYRKFLLYESRGCRVKYCDTDSIVIPHSQLGLIADLISTESGGFKIEESFASFCALAPKEYLFLRFIVKDFCGMHVCEQSAKIKGCTRGKMEDLYFGTVRTVRPMKFQETLRKTGFTNDGGGCGNVNFERAVVVEKRKRTFYDKRIVQADLTTIPMSTLQTPEMLNNELNCYLALHHYLSHNTLIDYPIPNLSFEHRTIKRVVNRGMDRRTSKNAVMATMDRMELPTETIDEIFDSRLTQEENIENAKNEWRKWTHA